MDQTIFPALRYRDADAALAFLTGTLGFAERMASRGDDGVVRHAELTIADNMVMLGQAGSESDYDTLAGTPGAVGIYVVIDDPDGHHDRVVAAGGEVVMGLVDQPYGSREFTVRDPEGNLWTFGTYQPWSG